jgi:hypothetical protein
VQASCQPGALRPHGIGWKITVKVRVNMHAQMRRRLNSAPNWNHAVWGLPVNQLDMIGTNLRFSVGLLDHMRRVGFLFSPEESEAVMMLWRYSGYLLGVEPELLCATEDEGRRRAQLIDATEMPPDQDSAKLTQALMETALPKLLWSALPKRVQAALSKLPQRRALPAANRVPWMSRYLYGLSHGVLGERCSATQAYPRTLWRHTARAMTGSVVSPFEIFRRCIPGGENMVTRLGGRLVKKMMENNPEARGAKFDMGDDRD